MRRTCYISFFCQFCNKEATYGTKSLFWLTVYEETVHHVKEGMAAGARGSWLHCTSEGKQIVLDAGSQLLFSF